MLDDTAIVYKAKSGLFIITGCSHSGICNIIEHAKKVCSSDKILGVIGGFHIFDCDERLECFKGTWCRGWAYNWIKVNFHTCCSR